MATHFSGDFYFCRNQVAFDEGRLLESLIKLECLQKFIGMKWRVLQPGIKSTCFCGSNNKLLVLVYSVTTEHFLMIDLISADNQFDIQELGEELIDFFKPQVVSVDTRLRGIHLLH